MNRLKLTLLAVAALLCLPSFASAANKALLIGVGIYQNACPTPPRPPCVPNLPGIDLDVQRMHRLALEMGFAESQIHVLMNEQATLAGIERELDGWFKQSVGPNDRLLLYFSSHGSLVRGPNGDVGAIIPHDVVIARDNLEKVLTGPMLARYLQSNPSRNILLVVDACHSGGLTSAKGIGLDFTPKVLIYPGMPKQDLKADLFTAGIPATKDISQPNYGYLSACRRDQVAAATQKGSVMTLALEAGWQLLRQQRQRASLQNVHPITLDFIKRVGINEQDPELFGASNLLAADWFSAGQSAGPEPGPGPSPAPNSKAWADLENVVAGAAGSLQFQIDKTAYKAMKEEMSVTVDVPYEGYLFIAAAGEGDTNPVLLFPNRKQGDNHVGAGPITIPQTGARFSFGQALPPNTSRQNVLLVVILSHSQNSLKGLTFGARQFQEFKLPGPGLRSPFVADAAPQGQQGYLAGKLTYLIVKE